MRRKKIKDPAPDKFFCIHCALYNEMYIRASYFVWDMDDGKILPLCEMHYTLLEKEEEHQEEIPFYNFSEN